MKRKNDFCSANRIAARALLGVSLGLLGVSAGQAAIAVRDDASKQVLLPRPAQRIVSLAPHATELIFAAGGGARIVGTVSHSDFPPAARDIPRVGDFQQVDIERILALKPDLLLVWGSGNSALQLEHLRKLGIPIFYSEPRKLDDIPDTIIRLGQLMGTEKSAQQAAGAQRQQLAGLANQYADRPPVRVFYQIWNRPLYTLNGEHIVSEAIRLCGGVNIFSALTTLAPTVTIEAVLQQNPEAIIGGEEARAGTAQQAERGFGGAVGKASKAEDQLAIWRAYPALLATRRGNLFAADADLLGRSGPRLITGAAAMCEKLEQARNRRIKSD